MRPGRWTGLRSSSPTLTPSYDTEEKDIIDQAGGHIDKYDTTDAGVGVDGKPSDLQDALTEDITRVPRHRRLQHRARGRAGGQGCCRHSGPQGRG